MLCSKCKNTENNEDRNFCSKCGALLVREDKNIDEYISFYENKRAIESKTKLLKRISIAIASIAIVTCMYGYKLQRDVSKYVDIVKEGTFENHPTVTINEGFEKFFEDTSWQYINSEEGYNIVQFSGSFNHEGQEVMTVMKFHINDDNTFDPNYLSFVDVSQDNYILYDLIDTVMSSY